MADQIGVAILAAGKGTRLKLNIPKALCPILGRTLLDFVLDSVLELELKQKLHTAVVIGHKKEEIKDYLETHYKNIETAIQEEQNGTAQALLSYFKDDEKRWENKYTFILCADTPLITSAELEALYKRITQDEKILAVAATFETEAPFGYGRIKRGGVGFRIIEEKDASSFDKKIKEVNSGCYLVKTNYLKEVLHKIGNENNSSEFYLTDIFRDDLNVIPLNFGKTRAFEGVNTLKQRELLSKILLVKKIDSLSENGVLFYNSESCLLDWDVKISTGAKIYPSVVLEGKCEIGENSVIESGVVIKDSVIKNNAKILSHSYLENCFIDENVSIGPMARIRPHTKLMPHVKIGNFVEVKNSVIEEGAKVSHLSYVGDASIGSNTNIGCGFITCNYDGKNKYKTVIGHDSFIGSDCQMIAPITIGNRVYIASGSTINKDVEDDAFSIARERQVIKEKMAKKFLKK